jgi:small-conductance mechanosensitive channel
MAEHVERVTQVAEPATPARASGPVILARIIWWIAGVIIVLLAARFLLALLGANQGNVITRFIFDASHPFVAPFFGLFSYSNYVYGVSRVEIYTLVAIAAYAVIAWGLARLATISHPNPRV